MGKNTKHFKLWILGFIVSSLTFVGLLFYVYQYKPVDFEPPIFNVFSILLTFALGFFPSIVSRMYANVKIEQTKFNLKGFVDSIRDSFYGWIIYYFLFVICFILYDWFVWNQLPPLW